MKVNQLNDQADLKNCIEIEWLEDEHECDTCVLAFAEGAMVKINGEVAFHLKPSAHCMGGDHWEREDVYKMILNRLGYST